MPWKPLEMSGGAMLGSAEPSCLTLAVPALSFAFFAVTKAQVWPGASCAAVLATLADWAAAGVAIKLASKAMQKMREFIGPHRPCRVDRAEGEIHHLDAGAKGGF